MRPQRVCGVPSARVTDTRCPPAAVAAPGWRIEEAPTTEGLSVRVRVDRAFGACRAKRARCRWAWESRRCSLTPCAAAAEEGDEVAALAMYSLRKSRIAVAGTRGGHVR